MSVPVIVPTFPSLPVPGLGQINPLAGLPALANANLIGQILNLTYVKTNIGGYFFDAVFRTEHQTRLQITSHPVQGGANISDHAFMDPARVVMEIGMSDAHAIGGILGQFTTAANRSQSAFDILQQMQNSKTLLNVYTRLKQYNNMLIADLRFPDDVKTATGLRETVQLQQVIVVDVPAVKVSSRPQTTGKTNGGTPNPIDKTLESTLYNVEQYYKK